MKTTIAKVTLTAQDDGTITWKIAGTVVARGCSPERPNVVQSARLYEPHWPAVFGSFTAGRDFAKRPGATLTRKLRLTTLGYDRDDRVVT